ncbi:class I SAM-dependent methyltransferase [Photobacterium sp. MCCC 1A19761]|uniref:class I SAM-dependent methyltransferase n=1 Tax=Photobacterium sp. MCCC 1A19761 TaxID=3115000 RepID=UPI00307CFA43
MTSSTAERWRGYYEKAIQRSHHPITEMAVAENRSGLNVAVDCGCGAGGDIQFLREQGYQVHGFDINADSIEICRQRFEQDPLIDISQDSFEDFDYPTTGVLIANASLYFAEPTQFARTWQSITDAIEIGGVFAGGFMGVADDWATHSDHTITALSRLQVEALFDGFTILKFEERNQPGKTALGRHKHWHTFSVVARKIR